MIWLRASSATLMIAASWSALEAKPAYLAGGWGGPHAGMTFEGGLAEVQFDCASGSIDTLVYLGKDGSFQAKGTYREGAFGPVRVGRIFRAHPATYSGNVTKDLMVLNVELEDGTKVGNFNLAKGVPAQLTRCQ
jgi:hypothetical protein